MTQPWVNYWTWLHRPAWAASWHISRQEVIKWPQMSHKTSLQGIVTIKAASKGFLRSTTVPTNDDSSVGPIQGLHYILRHGRLADALTKSGIKNGERLRLSFLARQHFIRMSYGWRSHTDAGLSFLCVLSEVPFGFYCASITLDSWPGASVGAAPVASVGAFPSLSAAASSGCCPPRLRRGCWEAVALPASLGRSGWSSAGSGLRETEKIQFKFTVQKVEIHLQQCEKLCKLQL